MKYKIGDVAKLIGMTPEAIRYYEDKNIIKPTRDANTGYRYYGVWDIHMLIRARHYRQYGYTLEETALLLNHEDLDGITKSLHEQEKTIQDNIILNIQLLKSIRQSQKHIESVGQDIGKYRIEKRPGMYRLSMQDSYTLHEEKKIHELAQQLIEKTPFVYSSALFKKESLEKNDSHFSFGLGVNEEYASFLGIESSQYVKYYPPCLCVSTCIRSQSDSLLTPQRLSGALCFMEKKGLALCGDVISRILLMRRLDGQYFNWHHVYLPIAIGLDKEK